MNGPMLERIKEVVTIASDPRSDVGTKKQALEFLEQIKHESGASEIFVSILGDTQGSDDLLRFIALQSLSDIVGATEPTVQSLHYVRDSLLHLIREQSQNANGEPEYNRNKIAEVFTKLFYHMYGDANNGQWNTFFSDIMEALQITNFINGPQSILNTTALDYFVRICIAVNTEIADQIFVRSKTVQTKNNELKDFMRIQDVSNLVTTWINILHSSFPDNTSDMKKNELASLTLSCIGGYISWIDVSLIATPNCISTIFSYLDYTGTQIACAQCLCEIVSKKMKPLDKIALLGLLNLTDKVATIGVDTDGSNLEIHECLAKLTSSVGYELAIILEQCHDTNQQNLDAVAADADRQILLQVVPLVLGFMEHEYDSVTQQTFAFISQYLSILKKIFAVGGKPGSAVALQSKRQPLDTDHQRFLSLLLHAIFKKMRIDDSCEEDSEDEIEEFNETIKSKMKVFQDIIAVISPAIYLEHITSHIQNCLNFQNWRDLELAIYQMNALSDSIRNNLFGFNKNEIFSSQPALIVTNFMEDLLQRPDIFQVDNLYVEISFCELFVRHHMFLKSNEKHDITLINLFCSSFAMFNKREKVRLRTWYLFTRLLKMTKPKYSITILQEIFGKLGQLLVIKVKSINPDGTEDDTTFDNQLYLFESVGLLIGSNSDNDFKIMDQILTPLFTELEACISSQLHTPEVVLQSHHILMAIGTLARGIHDGLVPENQVNNVLINKNLIPNTLRQKFSNIAEVVLVTFSYFNTHETTRDASRFTFSRLIPILNNEIVPYANKLIALFLQSDLKTVEMNDFLSFLGQMIHMFKTDEGCYELFCSLFSLVIDKVHSVMMSIDSETKCEDHTYASSGMLSASGSNPNGKSIIVTDSYRDRVLMKKAYFTFLQTFVTNNVTSILLTETNRQKLPSILDCLLSCSPQEIQESSVTKLAFNVLTNFVKYFGSGSCVDQDDSHAAQVGSIEGLNEFFISKVIPLAFEIPFNPVFKFDIKEGGSRVLAIDLARLVREVYLQSGPQSSNKCLQFLTEVYLPQVQFPAQFAMELVEILVTQNQKAFEKYYVSLIEKLTA